MKIPRHGFLDQGVKKCTSVARFLLLNLDWKRTQFVKLQAFGN